MKYLLSLLLLLMAGNIFAQEKEEYDWKTNLRIGDELFTRGSFFNASDYYQKVLKVKPEDVPVLWKLAECDRLIRDYFNASAAYKKLLDKDPDKYPVARFYYAQMLKLNGNCEQAITEFDNYTKSKNADAKLVQRAALEKQGCAMSAGFPNDPDVKIKHLDSKINSLGEDFAPYPVSATELMYASIRTDTAIVMLDTVHFYNKAALSRLYDVKLAGDTFATPVLLPDVINGDWSAANGVFSPGQSLFFFNECSYNPHLDPHCEIYVSRYKNGQFDAPIKLPPQINSADFTSAQPTVVTDEDGKNYLYYSSDRPNGQGGRDIWYSTFDDNLSFGASVNAGTAINTPGDEMTPFFDVARKYLYFSSNGLPGLGGFDIFYSTQADGKWQTPVNIGKPFNSSDDDMYYTIATDMQTGYLVSNRPGTLSLRSESTSDDIYGFKLKKIVDYNAYAYQLGDSTKTPLTDFKIASYIKNPKTGKYEITTDTTVVDKGDHLAMKLKGGHDYKFMATKDKYLSDTKFVSAPEIESASGMQTVNFSLDKINKDKTYKLNNIYYDYNSATLRDSSKMVLDTLLTLLDANPKIVIELSSHTDSRGNAEYNLKLSQERAESCVNYLISKGITANRLIAKGYGKEKILNRCTDGVQCTEEEHQVNRRTEFKVIGETEEGTKISQ